MTFDFAEQGAHAAVRHAGQEILRLDRNSHFFAGHWLARDQVMLPGGRPEVASLPVFSSYGRAGAVTDVRYEATPLPNGLRLRVVPTATQGGAAPLDRVRQDACFEVRLEGDRFVWRQEFHLEALADLDLRGDGSRDALGVYRFPHQDGRPGLFLQFADPQPCCASGPAVPMQRDWLEHYEPYVGPDTFRQHWRRRYVTILFQDPDDSFACSELNKAKWHHLTLDNRRARPCHPRGLLYVLEADGGGLEYRCDAPSHYHHVCEWGMDFHFWCDLGPLLRDGVLKAGTRIACATTARRVTPEVTAPLLAKARRLELTPREREIADRPAYEEPENSFTVSVLERPDAQPWTATSEGCAWQRTGGRTPGSGCLVIHNRMTVSAEWRQESLGPSQWGNPFMPGARYRLSAWVRLEDWEPEPGWPGPQLGVELCQYEGPACTSRVHVVDGGWSAPLVSVLAPLPTRLEWTRIELVTPPCPSYVLRAVLKLRLFGRGTGYFANVRWEPLPDDAGGSA